MRDAAANYSSPKEVYAHTDIDPNALATAGTGAVVASCMPAVEELVAKLERGVENRVAIAVANGTFTQEQAMQLWMEKLAYRKVVINMQKVVQMGMSAVDK